MQTSRPLSNALNKLTNHFSEAVTQPFSLALCKYFNDEAQTHGDTRSQRTVSATCRQTSAFYKSTRHYLQVGVALADAPRLHSSKDGFLFISLAVSILPASLSRAAAATAAAHICRPFRDSVKNEPSWVAGRFFLFLLFRHVLADVPRPPRGRYSAQLRALIAL